jgi:hypothetical protein
MPEFSASQLINPDYNGDFNKAALEGVQRQQEVGGLNALQGVDLGNPQSVNNAIGNLVKTNNLEKANALIGVQQTQTILPIANQALKDALADKGQLQQPTDDAHAQVGSHAAETLNMAVKDLNDIKALPSEQRLDAADALMQKYKERGIDPQAIAGITSDMSDQALDKNIAQLSTVAQHYGNVATGQPSDYTHQDQNLPQWAVDTLHNGKLNNPVVQGMFKKYLGIDIEPQLQRAAQLALPGISKAEEESHAQAIAGNTERGKLPYDLIRKEGEAEIEDPRTQVEIKMPDGSVRQMNRKDAMILQAMKIPGVGQSQGTEAKAHDEAAGRTGGELDRGYGPGVNKIDAANMEQEQTNLTAAAQKAATNLRSPMYDEGATNARQIIDLGSKISTGPWTKDLSDAAQKLAPLLPQSHLAQYATDSTLLSQDLSKAMKLQFAGSALPRIASEFNTITAAVPKNTSPGDTVKLYGALALAKNNMEKDADQHLNQYQNNPAGPRSFSAATQAFDQHRPSLLAYALPELRNMKINGQPAVKEFVSADGKKLIGVFMPDPKTGKGQTFYIGPGPKQ